MGLLTNKTYVVMGVANHRSIAWGIAQSLHEHGAKLVFTYQGERLREGVEKLVATLDGQESLLVSCDVTSDEDVKKAFETIGKEVGVIHGVAHCIAFANKEDLQGEFIDTSRQGYHLAQDISSYSLVAVAREAKPFMTEGGSIVTLTYLGGERVVKNYNLMGVAKAALDANVKYLANDLGKDNIRVNAVSAGPIRTLAAKGVGGFNDILRQIEENAPLRRTVDQREVGDSAMFLLSDLSRGVTGEILHVDAGHNILGF
ncbi:enoyl-[acyl-carrier-protein] reductase FabI [Bacillus cereus]|uniref:Enoyl-[acyl-carrier-protein] reductase [NADH] n=2 Tax=Bacillus cereus group TaxID=86661 RepID=A0A9X6SST3_BACCE|nr:MULTISPECIES: enoyl-ACP reductase FabI [Bacillus cereus group]PDZ94498.1 enoyl-[acyl-carrier-protein] reductase FabI [Bacillus cereus]PFJ24672.1 enoyl-[acyl-carrier-protein] reductase FabI [Bacillus thuringiensis]PGP11990.1 enoyl-[acyl-carrier-protein] reductase FabI [Bacillus cereus]